MNKALGEIRKEKSTARFGKEVAEPCEEIWKAVASC